MIVKKYEKYNYYRINRFYRRERRNKSVWGIWEKIRFEGGLAEGIFRRISYFYIEDKIIWKGLRSEYI